MQWRRAFIVATLLALATITPVRAETVYAYWSYWQGDSGTWTYATSGPATSRAVDGAIDGWRFTLGSDGRAAHPTPAPDFAAVCGATARPAGTERVAIVIDYGTASESGPTSSCAVIPSGLSRMSAFGAMASLRLDNGFVCGVNGIPAQGCGDAVSTPTRTASPSVATSTSPERATGTSTKTPTAAPKTPRVSQRTAEPEAPAVTPAIASPAPSAEQSLSATAGQAPEPGSAWPTVFVLLCVVAFTAIAVRGSRRRSTT